MRKLVRGIAAPMMLAWLMTPIAIVQAGPTESRTELLLRKLESLVTETSEPRATVSRSFAIRVRTNVLVASSPPPAHDVMCEVTLFHSTVPGASFFEEKSQKYVLPASGGSFFCDITINARWLKADTTKPIGVTVRIRPVDKDLANLPNTEEYARRRESFVSLAPIPLPATGATVTIQTALTL